MIICCLGIILPGSACGWREGQLAACGGLASTGAAWPAQAPAASALVPALSTPPPSTLRLP